MENKYSILILKTTGNNRPGEKIIEINLINYDLKKNKVEETFSTVINPERSIGHKATLSTGITNMKSMNGPKFFEVAKRIVEMTENRILTGHNIAFDFRFIQREFSELGYKFDREVLEPDMKLQKKLESMGVSSHRKRFAEFKQVS
jgi:DNA polymerase-3 subunit epsilon